MYNAGDFQGTETVVIPFNAFSSDDPSTSVTVTNLANTDVVIYKDGSITQRSSASGVAVVIDVDSVTGRHWITIDLSDNTDAGFYSAGSTYLVGADGITVDSATLNPFFGGFSIGKMQIAANAALVALALDHLIAVADDDDVANDSVIGKLASTDGDWSNFVDTTDSLQSLRDHQTEILTDTALLSTRITLSGTANAGDSTVQITLTGGVATDGYYNGQIVAITGGTGAGQSRTILNYLAAGTVATPTRDWAVAPDGTSTFAVFADDVPAILEAGVATAGADASITLDATASTTVDIYKNNFIMITGGTGAGQTRLIGAYSAGRVATILPNWTVNPDATSIYQVLPMTRVDVQGWLGNVVTGDGDWAALKAETAAIVEDTAEIGVAGAGLTEAGDDGDHLTAINLPNQTMDITGNITGNLSGSVGSVTGAVGSVAGNVDGNVTGTVAGKTPAEAGDAMTVSDKTGFSLAANQSAVTIGTVTTNTDMRGTDGANTTTPPTVAEIQAELEENGASILDTLQDRITGAVALAADLATTDGKVDTINTNAARLTAARAQVLTDLIDGGRLDVLIDAITAQLKEVSFQKNTASQYYIFPMFEAGTRTLLSGLTVGVDRVIDGGSKESATGAVAEIATTGYYRYTSSAADLNGAGILLEFDGGVTADIESVFIRTVT